MKILELRESLLIDKNEIKLTRSIVRKRSTQHSMYNKIFGGVLYSSRVPSLQELQGEFVIGCVDEKTDKFYVPESYCKTNFFPGPRILLFSLSLKRY